MEIKIDTKVLKKHRITLPQFLYLLALRHGYTPLIPEEVCSKKLLTDRGLDGTYYLNANGSKFINRILVECLAVPKQDKKAIEKLARDMQKMYPSGRKAGTNNYWRGNFPEIRDRLITFFNKHGEFPAELVLQATQKYIDSYGEDTAYMKTLKYFISKRRPDGAFDYDLLTFIENIDSTDEDGGVLNTSRLV